MPQHRAYGLTWSSEITLPGIPECAPANPDVVIVEGPVASAEPGLVLIECEGGVRLLIEWGARITYERPGTATDRDVVAAIMGEGLAAILLQREMLPLRACAVMTHRGAIVVIGAPGAGKSTLLGGMLELGHAMMADDVTAITLDPEGCPCAVPGFPVLGGRAAERFHAQPAPVAGLLWLVAGDTGESRLTALDPEERAEPLCAMIPRREWQRPMELEQAAVRQVAALAQRVPMVKYERPTGGYGSDAIARHALAAAGV
jgi:hypothetical protein